MSLQAVLNTLEGVPEALRNEYKKGDDGRFYLDVSGVDEMPAVKGLKAKNTELLGEKKAVQDKLTAFGDLTPEKVEELKKSAAAGGNKDVKALEEKLTQTQQQAQLEIKKAQDEAATARKAAEDYFIDNEVTKALSEAKGSPALLSHVMRERVEVKTVDGKFTAIVIDPKTKAARIKDSAGNAMTLADVAAELKADATYGRAFEPSGKSGSGAETTTGGGGGGKTIRGDDPIAFGQNLEAIAKGEVTVTV